MGEEASWLVQPAEARGVAIGFIVLLCTRGGGAAVALPAATLVAPAHFRSTMRPSTPGDTVPLAPM